MIVCHCFAVNDRRIRELVQSGAMSVADVISACDAGRDCGSCVTTIRQLVLDARETRVAIAG